MTVSSIVQAGRRADGESVEVRGEVKWGFETFMFRDASTCPGKFVCAIWLTIDSGCTVTGGSDENLGCGALLEKSARRVRDGDPLRKLYEIDHVILRGVVATIRRDVPRQKKAPFIGFGHLDAYPAKLRVQEVEVEGGAELP